MNKTCRHVTVDNQNGLNGNTLYNMKRNKEKAICAELSFAKVMFVRKQYLQINDVPFPSQC